ncbi:Protoheme IX farnesyltransferase, mitochondrial [Exophiala xenobiotica]|uniref:Protoheme IX farnesyltransferase, mitochondrial n=1 Tax=Lithohypha guttulata TaxID=1690604 RepID=A0ABR0K3B5_9EURO|nr:Protoheme IX farnesyltransferase, mitochondrial [Lithohypha guttulata]KAK5316559.1 Protoheme IX farnesyltransferase, mitochondrial [Exophiala xenobiotica]
MRIHAQSSFHDYFSANESIDRGWLKNGLLAVRRTKGRHAPWDETVESTTDVKNSKATEDKPEQVKPGVVATAALLDNELLPHRRRWQQKKAAQAEPTKEDEEQLPLDASSRLATAAAAMPDTASLRRKMATYLSLSKPRLSFLILLTTTSAYSLYPIPDILSSTNSVADANTTLSTSTLTFLFLTTGTFLSCASANAFNMLFEPKYDALMTRTRNRPLVRKLISPRGALLFAVACGLTGLALLDFGTNPTVAALSGLNIFLYGFIYTPMKRISWLNTWVGAIVGGIPPLMGWAAAAGETATSEHHSWKDLLFSDASLGGWLLAGLLFAWQFPHFNSLSHTIRDDYKNAGHKMLAWMNPARNARVALRYSIAMFPLCFGMFYAGLVNPGFLVISSGCNLWMLKEAVKFWKHQGAQDSARGLFWASVWQLPLVLVGALLCKTGIWDGFLGGKEQVSIYEDLDEVELVPVGEGLGKDEHVARTESMQTPHQNNHNLAMLGFKPPS